MCAFYAKLNSRHCRCKQRNGEKNEDKKIYMRKKTYDNKNKGKKFHVRYIEWSLKTIRFNAIQQRRRRKKLWLIFKHGGLYIFLSCIMDLFFIVRTINNLWFWLYYEIERTFEHDVKKEDPRQRAKDRQRLNTLRLTSIVRMSIKWWFLTAAILKFYDLTVQ